jgi:hypothetical protein
METSGLHTPLILSLVTREEETEQAPETILLRREEEETLTLLSSM